MIKNFFKQHWMIVGIMVVATFMRFWQIGDYPGGLFPDEAANGLDINSIFKGDLQPFYEKGNGREALFFYVIAVVVALFGRGPWQHHVVSAGFGVAEVFVAYLLTSRLFGKRMAYLASFLMAVSAYVVTLNRTAFRANTIPLFTGLTLYFLVKYFQSPERKAKLWALFWSGVSFGLGFYTYISYRMMIPLIIGFAVLLILAYRDRWPIIWANLKMQWSFVFGFILSFFWLGYYFWTHPGSFVGRAGQVSIFSPDLNNGDIVGTFLNVFKLTIIGFFQDGDLNWRHNVSGYGFLSPFVSPFFAIGLIIFSWAMFRMLKQIWQKNLDFKTTGQALIAILFWFMLVPEVTTAEGIPHGLRLVGVIPAIFIMSAHGMLLVWDWLSKYTNLKFTRIALPTVYLTGIFIYGFYLYFGVAVTNPEYYYAFRSDLTTVSEYLNKRNYEQQTYLSLDKFSVQTVEYFTTPHDQPYTLLDPANTYQVKLNPGDQVVFTQSTLFDVKKFVEYHPTARLIKECRNEFNYVIMRVYEQPTSTTSTDINCEF